MIIDWKTLYNTSEMSDMRDMIAPINRLILKLEDSKTAELSKVTYVSKKSVFHNTNYWRLYALPEHSIVNHNIVTEINKAESFWRGILEMVSYQRKEND